MILILFLYILVALAQVMTRMKLNWCGQRKGDQAASKTWMYILWIFCAYTVIDHVLDWLMLQYAPTQEEDTKWNCRVSTPYWIIYSVRMALR